jgi:hypothetical protein
METSCATVSAYPQSISLLCSDVIRRVCYVALAFDFYKVSSIEWKVEKWLPSSMEDAFLKNN